MSVLNMPSINQVALSGRLTHDPEYRLLDNGSPRLKARLAVNRSYRDRNDTWQEETSFFDLVLWQRSAEHFSQRLSKGIPVFVTGRLRSHHWRDEQDQPHTRVEVQVRNLQILEREESAENDQGEEETLQAA